MKYQKPFIKQIVLEVDYSAQSGPDNPSCGTGSCCYADNERTGW